MPQLRKISHVRKADALARPQVAVKVVEKLGSEHVRRPQNSRRSGDIIRRME